MPRSFFLGDFLSDWRLLDRKGGAQKFVFRGFLVRLATIAQKFPENFNFFFADMQFRENESKYL